MMAMTTNRFLRTIDRWRFDAPLALLLAIAAAFAMVTMPAGLFGHVPVAGGLGGAGRAAAALLLAVVLGGGAYLAMRRAATPGAVADPAGDVVAEPVAPEDVPTGMPSERLMRLRRADAHPDAPPREPIIASRDLGEPFMDVGTAAPSAVHEDASADEQPWWPENEIPDEIPDAEYVEVSGDDPVADDAAIATSAADADAEAEEARPAAMAEPVEAAPADLAAPVEPAPVIPAVAPPPQAVAPERESIAAMMERLSAGLERRRRQPEHAMQAPARDMRPALRDALDELNRLAERHG